MGGKSNGIVALVTSNHLFLGLSTNRLETMSVLIEEHISLLKRQVVLSRTVNQLAGGTPVLSDLWVDTVEEMVGAEVD
tara:strand:- start:487 stop:720 length:234 start_codon:yes stop_codon:yes gene_type:complete